MLTYTWGLSYMSPQIGGLSYIFRPKKRGSFRLSLPAYLFYGSAPPGSPNAIKLCRLTRQAKSDQHKDEILLGIKATNACPRTNKGLYRIAPQESKLFIHGNHRGGTRGE